MKRWIAILVMILLIGTQGKALAETVRVSGSLYQFGFRVQSDGSVYFSRNTISLFRKSTIIYKLDVEAKNLQTVLRINQRGSEYALYEDGIAYSRDPGDFLELGGSISGRVWYVSRFDGTRRRAEVLYRNSEKNSLHRSYFSINDELYFQNRPDHFNVHLGNYRSELWKASGGKDVLLCEVKDAIFRDFATIVMVYGDYIHNENKIKLFDVVKEEWIEIPYESNGYMPDGIIACENEIYMSDLQKFFRYDIQTGEVINILERGNLLLLCMDGDYIYVEDRENQSLIQYSIAEQKVVSEISLMDGVSYNYKVVVNEKLVIDRDEEIWVMDLSDGTLDKIPVR